MNRILVLAFPMILVACSATPNTSTQSASLGMVRGPQDSESSFKGKPGDGQDSSFKGKPDAGSDATPTGAGFNQAAGQQRPQMGGGDVHYHTHYHGGAQPQGSGSATATGFAAPVYGAPARNGNLGQYNNAAPQAPLGTGGGGAGWYGPEGNSGIRQGYGVGGWGTRNGYGSSGNNGSWNGYTD